MRLNIGCCTSVESGFVNVDLFPPCDLIADLNGRWPFGDDSVGEIRAWDILEHLSSPIHSMNEAHRILRHDGRLDVIVPTTDGRGWAQDPTHVCYPPWNRNSFFYFEHGNAHCWKFASRYGVRCAFRVLSSEERMIADQVSKLHIILQAVK